MGGRIRGKLSFRPVLGLPQDDDEGWTNHAWGRAAQSPRAVDLEKHSSSKAHSKLNERDFDGIDSVLAYGFALIVVTVLCLSFAVYAIVISKLLPFTGNIVLDAIKEDRFYCYLIPLTIPVTFVAVYFHWLSLKFFKHA